MNWDKYRQQHNTIIKDYHDGVMSYNAMGYYLDDLYMEYKDSMEWTNHWREFWAGVRFVLTDNENITITQGYHDYIAQVSHEG